jgi:Amino acid synthesis
MSEIRKIVRYVEDVYVEGKPGGPVRMAAVAAVIKNPWAGQGYVENLRPEIMAIAPGLGRVLVDALLALFDADPVVAGAAIEAYGKAAVVGTSGEIEHASALIHTLRFGNVFREAVGGTAYLSFTNSRGGPGCQVAIPMMHKIDEGLRSHYLTLNFTVSDAPAPDELVVAIGAANGGRLHPRLGNRYMDIEEMAAEKAAGKSAAGS